MHKTHHFKIKNAKIFWGGDTLPRPHPPQRLDLRAYGAQAQRDTPRKNLVTALRTINSWRATASCL